MSKNATRAAVYLLLGIPLIVIAILVTRQIDFAFNFRKTYMDHSALGSEHLQQILLANELTTRSFFLIFICFLLLISGLLIIFRGHENALKLSKDPSVRSSLKTTYPGVVMAILGCIILGYAVYNSSRIQFQTAQNLMRLKVPGSSNPLPEKKGLGEEEKETGTDENVSAVVTKEVQTQGPSQIKYQGTKENLPEEYIPRTSTSGNKLSPEEIQWSENLAKKALLYNLQPSPRELENYQRIRNQSGGVLKLHPNRNQEIHWAFQFFLRTRQGYEPDKEELARYEAIVHKCFQANQSSLSVPGSKY
jgi:uncharacterized membrane protein